MKTRRIELRASPEFCRQLDAIAATMGVQRGAQISPRRSVSRFRIDHPHRPELHAEAGHDPVLGFFVDIMKGGRVIRSYDHFNPLFNRARPLLGCLDFLVVEQFFTAEQLENALVYLQDGGPEPKDMRVVEVVMEFKQAAG